MSDAPDDTGVADDLGGSDRTLTLTDGVVAIALTLLALDLKPDLPSTASSHRLASYLHEHASQYGAFALAFLLVAQYWSTHHQLMRHVHRATAALHRMTFVFLFGITVVPLTTYLTGTFSNALATTLFAANVALVGLSLAGLGEIIHTNGLDDHDESAAQRRARRVSSGVRILIPVLVGGGAWVVGPGAAWLYLLFLVSHVPGRLVTRRMPA